MQDYSLSSPLNNVLFENISSEKDNTSRTSKDSHTDIAYELYCGLNI